MYYKAQYLPVNRPLKDGDPVVNDRGDKFLWDEAITANLNVRPAELFLVSYNFNKQVIVGVPSEESKKWLQPNMQVKMCDCSFGSKSPFSDGHGSFLPIIHVKCPCCQTKF